MKTISLKKVSAVAVASLGFGLLSVVPANAVTETVTATMSGPVRVSFTDSTRDAVAAAEFTVTSAAALADATTDAQLTVTQAPTSGATMSVLCGGATAVTDSLGASGAKGSDGAILGGDSTANTAFTCTVELTTAAAAGAYKASLVLDDTANGATDTVTVNISFTTTGKAATIKTDASAYTMPATTQTSANTFLTFKTVAVELLDTSGVKTQAATGDNIVTSITSATNINTKVVANNTGSADLTISSSDLNDGAHSFLIGSVTTTADTETITLTPGGVMPAQGVVAKTITASTAAYGTETAVRTTLTSPTAATVVSAGTKAGSENSYKVEPSVRVYEFTSTGYAAGAAYRIGVEWTEANGGSGSATVQDDVANTTAASLTSGTVKYVYGLAPASGTVKVSVAVTTPEAGETIEVNAENANTDYTAATDALVTLAAPTYAITLTNPVVTPSINKTSSALTVAGVIKDSYGALIAGATVSVSGSQTLSAGTAAALTGSAVTAADGTFTTTLAAANALTTSVALTVTAAKVGISITQATATVNLNASGGADTMTVSLLGDEDTAATKTAATQLPAILVPYVGRAADVSDEIYTVSSADFDGTFDTGGVAENCIAVTVNTSPGGQVVATGTAGVLFYSTACANAATHDVSAGKSTVTVAASGSANLWVTSTKTGLNTFTVTSGTVTNTYRFYAYNQIAAGNGHAMRNIGAPTTAKTAAGGIAYVTLTPTDAFGNVLKSVANNAGTITVKAGGGVLLDGPALSRTYNTTDADGNILVGLIAGQTESAATLTITSTGAQFGAAAGAASGTTAGTNGLTASVSTGTVAVTVGVASNTITAMIDALNAKIVALNALIAKIMRKLGVK